MKQKFALIAILLCLAGTGFIAAQTPIIDMGIFNNPANSNKLEIRIRPNQNVSSGVLSAGIFTVRYLTSYNVTLSVASSIYGYGQPLTGTSGGYTYFAVSFAGQTYTVNWNAGQEYVVAILQHSNTGSGYGTFELVTGDSWTNAHNGNFYQELDGLEAENAFYHTATSAPLPIELLEFNAKVQPDHSVKLNWNVAAETGLSEYQIEHSTDGLQFNQIGQIPAKGVPVHGETDYRFIHQKPEGGANYYRLRMVDLNGLFEYSPLRMVSINDKSSMFSLLPNPTTGPLLLQGPKPDQLPPDIHFQLIDASGKLILEKTIAEENTHLDLSNYPQGLYYLNVLTNIELISKYPIVLIH